MSKLRMGRDNDFHGKVICLTGGASGIGLATAQILHSRGACVAVADIDDEALLKATELLKGQGGDRVMLTKLDVTDRKAVDSWVSSVVQKFGHLDGAAN